MSYATIILDFSVVNRDDIVDAIDELNNQFGNGLFKSEVCANRIRLHVEMRAHSSFWKTIDSENNVALIFGGEHITAKTYFHTSLVPEFA